MGHRFVPIERGPARPRGVRAIGRGLFALLCLAGSAGGGTAIAAPHEAAPPLTARDLLRFAHSPREGTVTFVHHVENTADKPLEDVEVAVALPASDARQRVLAMDCLPPPVRTTEDAWGQTTAHFRFARIEPGGEASVRVRLRVVIQEIEWLVTEREVGKLDDIPADIQRQYLRDGANYQLDAEVLRRANVYLSASRGGVLEKVRTIHDFVVDSLEYRRDDRWDPADQVLRSGAGSCSEYTYLMISLCRLQGIPARYAGGTWLDGDQEQPHVDRVFHRWVEVYLPRIGWYPVDPTQDDASARQGDPYRYFGRLPSSYLTMMRGDGDLLESGRLGWEYRSSMRWRGSERWRGPYIPIDRYAVWCTREAARGYWSGTSLKKVALSRS